VTDFATVLHPPRAHGAPLGRAQLRAVPEDFCVREWLGFEADNAGDHWLLKVRKRDANTLWVAKQLARIGGAHPKDVGFAGIKDRHALTEQSFTVPARGDLDWLQVRGEGFEVIAAARHRRKLKRGALKGNDFAIVLRDFSGDVSKLRERVSALSSGVPNYFGPQRFGRDANNLTAAQQWAQSGRVPLDRHDRSFAISAARSAIFNAVLAARVADGSWNRLGEGDVANLDGSGSVFAVASVDEVLARRCEELDIHPTGPLWGMNSTSSGAIAGLEAQVAAGFPEFSALLGRERVEAERRPLRMRVNDLTCSDEDGNVRLTFRLSRGSFATAVLHELIDNAFDQAVEAEES
jgi:tRNA pseudouridine13 synthase